MHDIGSVGAFHGGLMLFWLLPWVLVVGAAAFALTRLWPARKPATAGDVQPPDAPSA
ncbi:MAG: hypothetical protein HY534_08175 [Chloroflexi bacterium]|nr:hypothetical protein [Chloroflexota bacterium]